MRSMRRRSATALSWDFFERGLKQALATPRGLSRRTVAGLAGLAPSTVSRLERAERRVKTSTLAGLADVLAPGRAGVLDELQQLAGPALVIVDRHPPATKRRERRRDRRAERFREELESRRWRRLLWRKLGVRVRPCS